MKLRGCRWIQWLGGSAVLAVLGVAVGGGCRGDFGQFLGGEDFLSTGRTLSNFVAYQIDPRSEDSAGPQFVVAADLNNDGLMDLVSAWNESQPVQLHLQSRTAAGNIRFETVILAGSIPTVSVAGLAVADFDNDARADIAVLVKETLLTGAGCIDAETVEPGLNGSIILYFGPSDSTRVNQALAWREVPIGNSFLQGSAGSESAPEEGGFTAMVVADVNLDGAPDLVVPWNSNCGTSGTRDVLVFTNNGPVFSRDGTFAITRIPDAFPKGATVKDVALGDIDGDGDLDIVATFPAAPTMNVRWYRNPAIDEPDDFHVADRTWQTGMIAQIATGADAVDLADFDGDGILDVLVRSTGGSVLQWLKGPEGPTTAPVRALPWQVYTLAEYTERTPEAIALGDLNFDGRPEVIASAEGGLSWFRANSSADVFDQWREVLIIDDNPGDGAAQGPTTTDPNVDPQEVAGTSLMNSIVVVDLDGDGSNDLVVTLDRAGLSGLTNDALVWFRNTTRAPN